MQLLKTLVLLSIILNGVLNKECTLKDTDCENGCIDSYFC